jgi:hypothetical protein
MNLGARAWKGAALGMMVLWAPMVACGGQVVADMLDSGGGAAALALTDYPCTAYTAFYYGCPFAVGTRGCQVVQTVGGKPDWSAPPGANTTGCPLEIVPPTSTGGATCVHVYCLCDSAGQWVSDPSRPGTSTAGGCP